MVSEKFKSLFKLRAVPSLKTPLSEKQARWLLLIVVSLVITAILFPSLFVPPPDYKVGDVAGRDIKSPKDFLVEDETATEKKRQDAAEAVLPVYGFDDIILQQLDETLDNAFRPLSELLEKSIRSPEQNTQIEPNSEQAKSTGVAHELVWKQKEAFEKDLGVVISDEEYGVLEINAFSKTVSDAILQLLRGVLSKGVVADEDLWNEKTRGITLITTTTRAENTVRDLEGFHPLSRAQATVQTIASAQFRRFSPSLRNTIIDIAQNLIRPNVKLNRNETRQRRIAAREDVKDVFFQIKQGEMILREGEKVLASHIIRLEMLKKDISKAQMAGMALGLILIFGIAIRIVFITHLKKTSHAPQANKDFIFLCIMLVASFLLAKVCIALAEGVSENISHSIQTPSLFFVIPIAAGAMTVCLFMGMNVAVPFALLAAILTAFLFEDRFAWFVYFLLNSLIGAYWVKSCKERGVLIRAGVKVGLVNIAVMLCLTMYKGSIIWLQLFENSIFGFAGGVFASIITTGIAPLMEMLFDYTTDIKMLEIANLEQPLIKRLMLEAPGTYHHSVIVGNMVEAAAASISANPLLAKVIAYYHDIGKISKPLYFIENQTRDENRHDKLAPSMSSLILISHVKEGVEIARKHKLGGAIVDAIQQHHGTALISFFYEKAKKLKGEASVNIDDFRYPGPKPQTKEAALVMLADVVEAASRSLEEPTPSRVQGLLQKMVNKVFLDGQLDDCDLTLRDLHEIAKSFNKTLNGIFHGRIEYPDEQQIQNKKANGDSNRQPAKSVSDERKEAQEEGEEHLKRLGMS
ncbi:MAG: HDIG domain-containing metalloprotein [Pseudomonadota bacterium]